MLSGESGNLRRRSQLLTFPVHRVENLGMQLLDQAHGLDGEIQLLVDDQILAERDRDSPEENIARQLLLPGVDGGLERVAVRTAIGEELQHFHMPGVLGWLPRRDIQEMPAWQELLLGPRSSVGAEDQRDGSEGAEGASFHGSHSRMVG